MPWFRVYSDIVDNDKIRLVGFSDRWFFVALLACKQQGIMDADQDHFLMLRRLSVKLGITVRELEDLGKRLAEVGLINAETFQPNHWGDRQFPSDTDPTSAERARRYRERKKASNGASRVTSRDGHAPHHANVTRIDTDTDTDKIRTTEDSSYVGQTPDVTPPEVQKTENPKTRELKASATRLLDWLNSKTGRAYKPLPVNLDPIMARLKEGASEVQIKTVISVKAREWGTDEKMAQYLRPATLFNRTKFWQYHGAIPFRPSNQEATP